MLVSLRLRLTGAALGVALGSVGAADARPKVTPTKAFEVGAGAMSSARAVAGLKAGGALYAYAEGKDLFVRPVGADGAPGRPSQLSFRGHSEFGVSEASMALLKNGSVAAAWTAGTGLRGAVFARVARPDGRLVSAEIEVSADPLLNSTSPSVAALSGGGFAVVWRSASDTGKVAMNVRIFDASGGAVGGLTKIAAPKNSSFSSLSIAALGAGFVMAYVRRDQNLVRVLAQQFSAAGKAKGQPIRLDEQNDRFHENVRIAPRAAGGFAVAWQENVYSGAVDVPIVVDTTLRGRFLTAKGEPAGRIAIEDTVKEKSLERAHALADTAAGLLVAWHLLTPKSDDKSDNDIRGTLVSAAGVPGPVARLTKTSAAGETMPRLAPLANGDAALGFTAAPYEGDEDPHGARGALLKAKP
ncbi:hypothetical protein ACFOWB_05685 [Chenggangzhangella methanolivorans]|uniref:hypothetical protein n=1 Tax=Chenggangzhangella methanolivorans TaxID=1437009 RepID=UPI003616CB4F